MFRKLSLCACALFFLVGASVSSVRVTQGEDGVNQVVALDTSRNKAEKAARDAAVIYCEGRGLEPVYLSEDFTYAGERDEKTGKVRKEFRAEIHFVCE